MLPTFLNPNNGGLAEAVVQVSPPTAFRHLRGRLRNVDLGSWTRTDVAPPKRASQRRGLSYEKRIHAALRRQYEYRYHESQVIHFLDDGGEGIAVPDGMIKDAETVVIIEVKHQHMPESWWQLRRKYEPLVRALWPEMQVILLEICRSLDRQMPYPEAFELVEDIDNWILNADDGALGVMQWRL